jgi:hypothetical protein
MILLLYEGAPAVYIKMDMEYTKEEKWSVQMAI